METQPEEPIPDQLSLSADTTTSSILVEGHSFCGGFSLRSELWTSNENCHPDLILPLALGRRFIHFLIKWFVDHQIAHPSTVSTIKNPCFEDTPHVIRLFTLNRNSDEVTASPRPGKALTKFPCLRVSGPGRHANIRLADDPPLTPPPDNDLSCDVLVHWLGESSLDQETKRFEHTRQCRDYVQLGFNPSAQHPPAPIIIYRTHLVVTSISELSSHFRIRRRSSYEAMTVDVLRQLRGDGKVPTAPPMLPDKMGGNHASLLELLFGVERHAPEIVAVIRMNHSATLVYRQAADGGAEGAWLFYNALHPSPLTTSGGGRMEGYNGLAGAIIASMACLPPDAGSPPEPWYLKPVVTSLQWQAAHWQQGFYKIFFDKDGRPRNTSDWAEPGFCAEHLADLNARVIAAKKPQISAFPIDIVDAVAPRSAWFLAKQKLQKRAGEVGRCNVEDTAQTLIDGAVEVAVPWLTQRESAGKVIPVISLGKKLHLIDRREVEDFLFVQDAFRNYTSHPPPAPGKPLNLAVFGPPGAGKSFGVTELCAFMSSLPVQAGRPLAKDPLTFNLSQFQTVGDLVAALHQVRSKCLEGCIPIVFIDEFDSAFEGRPFGWLKYFLAPMQDGKFSDGSATYILGQCVLVFAGGINRTFDEFNGRSRNPAFVEAKGPDFISRLRGHLNIRGINKAQEPEDGGRYILRRAVFLQSVLTRYHGENLAPQSLMDENLARAFLKIDVFKHGARSMEAILDMSSKRKGETYRASDLPPRSQMDMHLDSSRFFDLLQGHLV